MDTAVRVLLLHDDDAVRLRLVRRLRQALPGATVVDAPSVVELDPADGGHLLLVQATQLDSAVGELAGAGAAPATLVLVEPPSPSAAGAGPGVVGQLAVGSSALLLSAALEGALALRACIAVAGDGAGDGDGDSDSDSDGDGEDRVPRRALEESELRYRTLVEHAPEAITVLDADAGHFVDVNANAERLFKMERAGLLQANPFELSPPVQPDGRNSLEAGRAYVEQALEGQTPVFEWIHRDARGTDHPCEIRLVQLPSSKQRLVRGSVTDISRRRHLEEQLRHAQKMEAIGRLAGGVAHDFNNLLTAIISYADLAQARRQSPESVSRYIEGIQRSAERAAGLTRQLLTLGRKQLLRPRVLDLNEIVGGMGELLERIIGEDIELRTSLGPGPLPVEADRVQLEQVMLNLCVNARDAMPDGGLLELETGEAPPSSAWARPTDGPYARLTVRDNGRGMDAATRSRAFEPFFTTKPTGEGSGLGLSTVYGIVQQCGGHVEVASEAGRGAAFHVDLPRSSEAPEPAEAPEPDGPVEGSETILLVEDDAAVRLPCAESLRRVGYWVIEAADGEQALALAAEYGSTIHVLVTDIVMPGMSGKQLADRLTAEHPEVRVLFMSGYTADLLPAGPDGSLEHEFLQKPFSPTVLGRTVRRLLDRPR